MSVGFTNFWWGKESVEVGVCDEGKFTDFWW